MPQRLKAIRLASTFLVLVALALSPILMTRARLQLTSVITRLWRELPRLKRFVPQNVNPKLRPVLVVP